MCRSIYIWYVITFFFVNPKESVAKSPLFTLTALYFGGWVEWRFVRLLSLQLVKYCGVPDR